jgi:hypothetical protein
MAFETERMRLPAALARPHRSSREAVSREPRQHGATPHPRSRLGAKPYANPRDYRIVVRLCFDEFLRTDYALPDPERAFDSPPDLPGSCTT